MLAYADENFAKQQFAAAGLNEEKFISRNGSGTQAYIAYNDTLVIVAFRGTQIPKSGSNTDIAAAFSASMADITTDAGVKPLPARPRGKAHGGFVSGWASVSDKLMTRLRDLKVEKPARSIWFTGHSLGGALAVLAVLAAADYGSADGLYTFGAPPVGDADFIASVDCPAFRFVHNNDAVPNVPIAYLHAGQIKYFDSTGELSALPPVPTRIANGVSDWLGSFTSALTSNGNLVFPRSPLTDHAPLYYALLVRHALDAQQ